MYKRQALVCWGVNGDGQLGLGHTDDIGDDEVPSPAGIVPLAQPAIDVAATFEGTCALLEGGAVQCWGLGELGTHGAGHVMNSRTSATTRFRRASATSPRRTRLRISTSAATAAP